MNFYCKWLAQVLTIGLAALTLKCEAGTWAPLNTPPPVVTGFGCPLLLTDGSIMMQDLNDTGTNTPNIWKLTPDINGSYFNGTWTQLASLPAGYAPLFHASAVLANGQVIFFGGEYNTPPPNFTSLGAIYDPVTNVWTSLPPPPFFPPPANADIGDASSVVLFDGTFMLQCPISRQAALLDLQTNPVTWTETGTLTKADLNDEEGWTLLPNGKVLTVDCGVGTSIPPPPTNSEIYDPATGTWTTAGSTIVSLTDQDIFEIGPATLRPDGTVFALGSTGVSSIYNISTGLWKQGPTLPLDSGNNQLGCADAPAALLPNGNVVFAAGPFLVGTKHFLPPIHIFEYDGASFTEQPSISNAANVASFQGNMLVLPTGQVLMTHFSTDVQIYTPTDTSHNPAWEPQITSVSTNLFSGCTYVIDGILFNGMSQASMYGDDYQSATNYPLVRITNNSSGHVFYCRTHDHSNMGVAQVGVPVHTMFDVPATIESGASQLVVVANGIPSTPVSVVINPQPVATATPSSQTICSGGTTSIALTSNVTGTTFSWTVVESGVSGASAGSGSSIAQTLTGNGTATYTITPTVTGCVGATPITGSPITVIVTVIPAVVATATPSSETICSGGTTNIALTSNVTGTTFSWTVVESGVSGASAGSGSTIAQTLTGNGTATYTVTPSANGCTGSTITVVVTVVPEVVATATPPSETICSGGTTNIALTSTVPGTTFSWTVVESGVSGASAGSGSTIAQTLTGNGTATYTVTPSTNGCTGSTITVVITVNPTPVATATPSSQTICSGATTNVALTSTVTGTTFSWTVAQSGVTGASAGSGSTIAQTLTGNGTATYTVTPSANGCLGSSIDVTVTVSSCAPSAPSHFNGKVRETEFATQTDVIHVLTWTPSTDPTVTGYRIYQGKKLIRTIPASGPYKVKIHDRGNKRYTYTLVAFNAANIESTPLTVTLR